jgi:hypothetical protein
VTDPVTPGQVAVEVTPTAATVVVGGTIPFAAVVTGTSTTTVTWSVSEPGCGSVSTAGLFSAPDAPSTCHVVVRSTADTTVSATAVVTVTALPPPVSPAVLVLSPAAHDYGSVTVGSSSTAFAFTVTNSGGSEATNVYLGLATGTQFTVSGNTCGTLASRATIPAGGTCGFSVAFSPSAAGAASDAAGLRYDTTSSTGEVRTATLSGTATTATGTVASLAFSPASRAFGTVAVGSSSAPFQFTVTNSGGSAATNVYSGIQTGTQFAITGNTCGTAGARTTIPAGGTCTFFVTFTPTGAAAATDTLGLSYDTTSSTGVTRTASISGTGSQGAAVASLAVSPATHAYGAVPVGTSSAPIAFTVTNSGGSAASNAFVALAAGTQFTLSSNTCGTSGTRATIAAGATCAFSLAYAPSSAGARSETVTVTYDTTSSTGQVATAAISGSGQTNAATLTFSPASQDFGNVSLGSTAAARTFTVANSGSETATNIFLALAGGPQFAVVNSTCGTSGARVTLAGGASCAFGVTFAPATTGAQSGSLTITYDAAAGAGQTATAALSGSGLNSTTHGLFIPTTHPRLWYDTARLARARTWYAAHPFTPSSTDHIGQATRGLLNNESAQCRTAINWAIPQSASIQLTGVSCDDCRWSGEAIILTYDWCYAFMTAAERSTLLASVNTWMNHWRTQVWGGPAMPENNYFWGNVRNELEWGITSYEDNVSMADTFLDDVFTTRLANSVYPSAASGNMLGGIGREGTQYGVYVDAYASLPWTTSGLLGRDLFTESNFWREAAYYMIYSLSPAPTTGAGPGQATSMGYTFFPFSDDEVWLQGGQVNGNPGNFMASVAMRWPSASVGQHARQWLNGTSATRSTYVQSVDPGGTALAFTNLPLDYYGPGAGMFYGRNAWGPSATTFFLKLKDGPAEGHSHTDWGTWQIWRNGRYLSRETVSYGESIAGYAGSGTAVADLYLGHNSLLVGGNGTHRNQWISGLANVTRLESRPAYTYSAVDLTGTIDGTSTFVHWEREFVFVRSLETMVILDRVQSASAGSTKTFLAHCETMPSTTASGATCTNGSQALVMTTLAPATRSYRVVAEGGTIGQYRIEVDTSPGTAQSYILTVLQAKDGTAASLTPTVAEDGASFTVTLNGTTSIVFAKGMVSSGGSITTDGATTPFRTTVQPISVTDAGPAWQ